MGYQGRDVEVTFTNDLALVAACDSCGAIGEKEQDRVRVSAKLTGRLTTRVALLEVLATGAEPKIVTAAICNEPDPTGNKILAGVIEELDSAGVGKLPVAISCEKNMPTSQTGIGITVVGTVERLALRVACTEEGDSLFCLGLPKFGPEVQTADDPEIIQARDVQYLLKERDVHDIIPVGSQGILGEIRLLTEAMRFSFSAGEQNSADKFTEGKPEGLDIHKSGGPATCLIFTAGPGFNPETYLTAGEVKHKSTPLHYLGKLTKLLEV